MLSCYTTPRFFCSLWIVAAADFPSASSGFLRLILPCHVEELLHCPRAFFVRPKTHTVFHPTFRLVVPQRQKTHWTWCVCLSLWAFCACTFRETLAFQLVARYYDHALPDWRDLLIRKNDPVSRFFLSNVNSTVIIHSLHPVSANYSSLIESWYLTVFDCHHRWWLIWRRL